MKWLQRVLAAVGVLMLGYCGYALGDSWLFQQRQNMQLEQLLHAPMLPKDMSPAMVNGLVGRIEVPRLGVSVVVLEGDGAAVLRHAAGHITGTALPGKAAGEWLYTTSSVTPRPFASAESTNAAGGRIPINTSGGLVSKSHPAGATGLAMVHELVEQLREEAGARQVPGARLALQYNCGGATGLDDAIGSAMILRT
jgi:hypothetical protein